MSEPSLLNEADVEWNKESGRPKRLFTSIRLDGSKSVPDNVIQFLKDHNKELGIDFDKYFYELVRDVKTLTGRILSFQQTASNIKVLNGLITVGLDPGLNIISVSLGNRDLKPYHENFQSFVKISPDEAKEKSLTSFSENMLLRIPLEAPELVLVRIDDHDHLAYSVLVLTEDPPEDWRFFIDATNGLILNIKNISQGWQRKKGNTSELMNGPKIPKGAISIPNANVFNPNPIVKSGDLNLVRKTSRDPNVEQWLDNVSLFHCTPKSSTIYQLKNNYINVFKDSGGQNTVEGSNFNFCSDDPTFEKIMVFFHVDTFQRSFLQYELGFIGDFERPGFIVKALPTTTPGSRYNFSDQTMWFGPKGGSWYNDSAEDGEMIIHEYGHAILDAAAGIDRSSTPDTFFESINEGTCTFLPCAFFSTDHTFRPEIPFDWIFANGPNSNWPSIANPPPDPYDQNNPWFDYRKWLTNPEIYGKYIGGSIYSAALWRGFTEIGGTSPDMTIRRTARKIFVKALIESLSSLDINSDIPNAAQEFLRKYAIICNETEKLRIVLKRLVEVAIIDCGTSSNLTIQNPSLSTTIFRPFMGTQQTNNGLWLESGSTLRDSSLCLRITNSANSATAAVISIKALGPTTQPFLYPGDFLPGSQNIVVFNLAASSSKVIRFDLLPLVWQWHNYSSISFLVSVYNPNQEFHIVAPATNLIATIPL